MAMSGSCNNANMHMLCHIGSRTKGRCNASDNCSHGSERRRCCLPMPEVWLY